MLSCEYKATGPNILYDWGSCYKNLTSRMIKVEVLVAQSCPTLCNAIDCSPPGSSVCGILQARILDGLHSLPHGIFLTQGRRLTQCRGLLHCRQILYLLCHQVYLKYYKSTLFCFKNIYLLIWLHWVSVAACRSLVSACKLLVVACGIYSLTWDWTRAPGWGAQSFTTGPPGKSLHSVFNNYFKYFY